MKTFYSIEASNDLKWFQKNDKKIIKRIIQLIEDIENVTDPIMIITPDVQKFFRRGESLFALSTVIECKRGNPVLGMGSI